MKFQFTKREEKLLIIFFLLHQYKNKVLGFFKNKFHPIVEETIADSKKLNVPKGLIKPLKGYHPYYFANWLYGGEENILNKRQTQLLQKFIKDKNIYDLIKMDKKTLKKKLLEEEKKWANGLKILKAAKKELPFPQSVNLVLNLFQGLGEGYGIKTDKKNDHIIIGPYYGESSADQVVLHEYLHITFDDWFKSGKGKKLISSLLKGLLKDKWQTAKRPWYPDQKTIAEEYFLRALTLRFLPKNLKAGFIKEQKSQGFNNLDKFSEWLSTLPD